MIEIKHRYTDAVLLHSDTAENIRQALMEAVQKGANLHSANLYGANLHSANLYGANLHSANLRSANLHSANLHSANLHSADLHSANLHSANLHSANLHSANLYGANLHSANLHSANLYGANLYAYSLVPSHGSFIGWKKLANGSIVKLGISKNARRVSSLVGRKCRAEYAKVLEIFGAEGESQFNRQFVYQAGKIVRPDSFDDDIRVECTHGIHFFITREEAEAYS